VVLNGKELTPLPNDLEHQLEAPGGVGLPLAARDLSFDG
jgi:hypothetical protein